MRTLNSPAAPPRGRRRRRAALLVVLGAVAAAVSPARASGHAETSIIPVGVTALQKGVQESVYRLAEGPQGVIWNPIVLIAAQPSIDAQAPVPLDPGRLRKPLRQQVPAKVLVTVGTRQLPAWDLRPQATAFVINLETLRANPQAAAGAMAIRIDVQSEAPELGMQVMAMPDPLLLNESLDGELSAFAAAAKDPDLRAYFDALALEVGGAKPQAREAYRKVAAGGNERAARLARRGLRQLSYELRERKLSGNFMEHYRWALYLEQAGLFAGARNEFDDCRIIDDTHAEAQYRTGEVQERLGFGFTQVLDYLERSATAARPPRHNPWNCLVVILTKRGDRVLTRAEVMEIKDHFLLMQGMAWGASAGVIRILPTFMEVEDEKTWSHALRPDGLFAPREEIVGGRGWFDSVFSVYPRLPDDPVRTTFTVGPDRGLRGAALSALPHDVIWMDYFKAWYEQLVWAADAGEIGAGYPDVAGAIASGHAPTPHRGQAYRSAVHYGWSGAMLLRARLAELPVPGTYVPLWRVEGPFQVKDAAPADGPPRRHVLDPLPRPSAGRAVSTEGFVDLAALMPDAGPALARATSYVYAPVDQEVRMWLGQNDGAAVWINGRLIHEGRYYSAHQFEDRNLTDTLASYAPLRQGWNEIVVVVEAWPAPRNRGWGFSVRLCSWDNQPVPGLAYAYDCPADGRAERWAPPMVGPHYSWDKVRFNYTDDLPNLSAADLQKLTGLAGLGVTGRIAAADGCFALQGPGTAEGPGYRRLSGDWQPGSDRDVRLNNVMDWARESCAAIRYRRDGRPRDLLLVKPEALDACLTLLREPPDAAGLFSGRPPGQRLLGYCLAPAVDSTRVLFAIDCLLPEVWPADEEDLFDPVAHPFVPNRKTRVFGQLPRPTSSPAP